MGNNGNIVFLFSWAPKVTVDSDCSREIKWRLVLRGKAMTNLGSILKSRDITLLTKVCLVKAIIFPIVMYGCESWTIEKAERGRINAFELWCWRRLLRVPWTARRSNQSIRKEISPEYSLEGLMLKLKLQYFGHLRGLTERGPLEKGMASHFSILALRTPWTIWKGKMIGYWKRTPQVSRCSICYWRSVEK